jgi:hypothetical protein
MFSGRLAPNPKPRVQLPLRVSVDRVGPVKTFDRLLELFRLGIDRVLASPQIEDFTLTGAFAETKDYVFRGQGNAYVASK